MKIVEFGISMAVVLFCAVLIFFATDVRARDTDELCWKWVVGQSRVYCLTVERHQRAKADRTFTTRLKVNAVLKLTARSEDAGVAVVDMKFESLRIEQHAGKTHYLYDSKTPAKPGDSENLWALAAARIISSKFEFQQGSNGEISDLRGFDENLDALLKTKRHIAKDTAFQVKRVFANTEFMRILNNSFNILPERAVSEGDTWERTEDIDLGIGLTVRRNEKYVFEKKNYGGRAGIMRVTMTGNMALPAGSDGVVVLPGGSACVRLGENSLFGEGLFSNVSGDLIKQECKGVLRLETVLSSTEDAGADRSVRSDLSQTFKMELMP